MNKIKISVRDLVSYVFMSGDLSSKHMKMDRALLGTLVHQKLQSEMEDNYTKEYSLKEEIDYKDVSFKIEGRADGIIKADDIFIIDEIKSTFKNLDYLRENPSLEHEAQMKVYAYMFSSKNDLKEISGQLRYFNLDTEEVITISYNYNFEELKNFIYDLLDCYLKKAKLIIKHIIDRKTSSKDVEFPFDKYRKNQRNMLIAVYQTILNKSKLFVEAPTGIGKTVSTIFPAVKTLNKVDNSKIFYLTAKSSTKKVAEETMKILIDKGLKLRTVIITAKEKICMNDVCICEPEFCPYAKDFFSKLKMAEEILENNYMFNREFIESCARKYEICPFELSLDLGYNSDVIVCDYNYYFDPRVALKRDDFNNNSNEILLIDEAHNLENRTRSMYSCELSKDKFYELYKLIDSGEYKAKSLKKILIKVNKEFLDIKRQMKSDKYYIFMQEPENFAKVIREFQEKARKWLEDDRYEANDIFETLFFESIFFLKIYELFDENFIMFSKKTRELSFHIMLINTSEVLRNIFKASYSAILFSATLTPLKFYKQILGGNEEDKILKLGNPFDPDNLKLMVTSNINMKYTLRSGNIEPICKYVHEFIIAKKGNYIVFFPSYEYLNQVYECYANMYSDDILLNNESITEERQFEIINIFNTEKNIVLFTVVGGVFSEGMDLPDDKLIGAVVIGTGIPKLTFERDLIMEFFDEKYKSGFDFAYRFMGFNKILQSVGRVIRTEEDRGSVLIIDSRILSNKYRYLYPENWKSYELVKNENELKNKLSEFW